MQGKSEGRRCPRVERRGRARATVRAVRAALSAIAAVAAALTPVLAQAPPASARAARPAPQSTAASQAGPTIDHGTAPVHPGDIVLLTVTTRAAAVTGVAAGKPVFFWTADAPNTFQALVAVPLDTRTGPYPVTVTAAPVAGTAPATRTHTITVSAKQFATRRLTVSPEFVNPPAGEAARIAHESEVMASIFAAVSPQRLWRGAFVAPVPGTANSSFGRLSVYNGEPRGRHQGADFAAATGVPVRAPNAGRVVLAQDLYFSGNTVILDHGAGLYSLVAHLSRIAVMPGATLATGDPIGEVGATGRVTGPHLHWAVRLGPSSVDPLSLMRVSALTQR